ncbi:hypothetical protein U9M48_022501 [Paspalum notatum var. saurae]|uniref:SPT2 chromatin protein n=1 Tax=Paspalum notatum var. saurae TaxID=547442 RepID=A0AAQ3TMB1_PASNO
MAGKVDTGINDQLMEEYYGQDENDLDDFIVDSDDDDHRGEQLEDVAEEEEVEEEEEEVQEEVEEEEEEAPVGQQEILSLREQLKEEIRRKNAAMAGSADKSSLSLSKNHTMPPAKDRYGTFFGPSKPVLARRVIEEGCSSIMKELQNAPSRVCKDVSLVSKTQPGAVKNMQKPKSVSEEKRKVDTLRENRDYSCLFSDDADTQPTAKDTQLRDPLNSSTRKSTDQHARLASKDHGLKGYSAFIQAQYKSGSLGRNTHAGRKGMDQSNQPNMKMKTPGLPLSSNVPKEKPSLLNKRPQVSIPSQRLQQRSQIKRPQGSGRQPLLQGRRPDHSVQGQHVRHNGSTELQMGLKSAQKQLVSSTKRKASGPMEKRAVKTKPHDENAEAFSMLRGMFKNYDPRRFAGIDEDDGNMEADFASIQKEERRSAVLARKEDEEQLRLIQEEERRERTMKRKKAAHT